MFFSARSFAAVLSSSLFVLSLTISSAGCGSPQRPVTFVTSAKMENGLDVVSRTLATEGYGSAQVDRQAGIAHSDWKDTGFLFGQVQGVNATIVRRITVVVAPGGAGAAAGSSNVTVRMDVKRCAQGGFSVENNEVRGPCEELNVVPERMQEEIDALGAKIHTALGS